MRLLTVDYNSETQDFYEDKVVYQALSKKIVKILADKDQLFVLLQSGPEYTFRCFVL